MRFRTIFRLLAPCVLAAGLTCLVYGQAGPPGGQGGQGGPPPQPSPQPQPQPRQPNVIPQPTTPSPNQPVTIRGRIIAGVHMDLPITEVRFETDGGQPIGFAYTDSSGEFRFQPNTAGAEQTMYVSVNVDGFKPYRERIDGFGALGFGGLITIFLEPETKTAASPGGSRIVDLQQLKAKIPGKAVNEYEKGLKESSKGNPDKAVEALLRAIKLAPDFYEAHQSLGVQYMALQKYDEAEAALEHARGLSPKASEPLINLGSLYYKRGEKDAEDGRNDEAKQAYEKSADLLQQSIRQDPLSAPAHTYLGAALYKVGEFDRAEAALNRALELDKDQDSARLMLVNVYTRSARYKDALDQANIFIEKHPKAPERASLESIKKQIEGVLSKSGNPTNP